MNDFDLPRRLAAEAHRPATHHIVPRLGVTHRLADLPILERLIVRELSGVHDRTSWNGGSPHQLHRRVLIVLAGPFADQCVHRLSIFGPGGGGAEAFIADQVLAIHNG